MRWKDIHERCIRWENTTVKILGLVEMMFALLLLVPAAFTLYYGEDPLPFLAPIPPLMVLGFLQYMTCIESKNFRTVNGIILVALVWMLMFAICTVPYILSGIAPVDAVFEAVSGVTTTGISALGEIDSLDTSLMIWRSMTQWIGGITVVIIFLYFLPMVGFGRSLFQNELAGSGTSSFTQRTSKAAKSFIFIYMLLSLANFAILLVLGVNFVEALCLMFTTISTGGLLIINSSMAVYSDAVQWVTMLFMFLGGTNFYLHYRMIYLRERRVYRTNSEFRVMIAWFLAISVILFLFMVQTMMADGTDLTLENCYVTFKNVLFTTVSLGTTTGFYVDDFTLWPSQCMILLMLVAVIGASTSSTSGGIKFSRLRIIYEYIKNGFRGIVHTNAVYAVKMDGKTVDDSLIQSTLVVFMMYMMTLTIAAVVFMIYGYDIVDSFGLSISAVSNGGMGFGNFGPTGNYHDLSTDLKAILIALMWIGRLEVVTAVVMFTPGFWKDVWLNSRSRRMAKRYRDRQGL
ncbi:MAG: TrkH family potassium uptake protein [Thermoplasmata archaeon]|nr:TrkH family potassium uptake protein [Thermoplasmata archaeon]